MAELTTVSSEQVNGSNLAVQKNASENVIVCKTQEGQNPLSLWDFIPKAYRNFGVNNNLQPHLLLGYKNAALVGFDERVHIPDPVKVTECEGINLCIDVEKHRDSKIGRVVPVEFIAMKAKTQLAKRLGVDSLSINFRGDLARKRLSMRLGKDIESEDFSKLIKAQIRVYSRMVIMEF